mgnify:CR=1 FL=1
MAHELTMNRITGKVEMGYAAGVDRWHGLGNEWLDTDTIEQKIEKAGMAWSAKRARVRYGDGPAQRVINDQHVLFRSDTKDPLGIVGAGYNIVQPREAIEFFETLLSDGFQMKTAGTLYGGKKFWAAASIGADATIGCPEDTMEGFLTFASSLDGSASTEVFESSICVVCDNTLRMALDAKRKSIRITHRSAIDVDKIKLRLGLSAGEFRKMVEAARALAKVKMDQLAAQAFVKDLLVVNADANPDRIDEGKHAGFNKIMALFGGEGKGSGLKGRAGTAWGAVNAVTEFVDQHAKAANAENRLVNAWWGDGDALKSIAMRDALALV